MRMRRLALRHKRHTLIFRRDLVHEPKKIYLVYMSFPYSDDPKGRSQQVKEWAVKLMKAHNDLVLLIPHFVFDAVLDFPTGYGIAVEYNMGMLELALIERMDIFAYHPDNVSTGVIWEKEFAKKAGVPILTYQELYQGVRP